MPMPQASNICFFYFAEDSKKAIPYFMLDSDIWEQIQLYIILDVK